MFSTYGRHTSEEEDRYDPGYSPHSQATFSSTAPLNPSMAAYHLPRTTQDLPTSMAGFDLNFATDASGWAYSHTAMSPPMYHEEGISSNISTASAPSAPSSAVGSPQPMYIQPPPHHQDWTHGGVLSPGIVDPAFAAAGIEYSSFAQPGVEDLAAAYVYDTTKQPGFVNPSLIAPEMSQSLMPLHGAYPPTSAVLPQSPALTTSSPHGETGSQSPYAGHGYHYPSFGVSHDRRQSIDSYHSNQSGHQSDGTQTKKKQCPYPECGKWFKDLDAHVTTHQQVRPNKCPITTCQFNEKGFARKYDKNRHTLTHYKGTMVCSFCPSAGSAAEKSFNRADVFKRHLTAVHGVEATPPNSRKSRKRSGSTPTKSTAGARATTTTSSDATGKCSTCSQTFSDVQDFYEHLDACVMNIIQQEDPAEAVNAERLAEVENDPEVHATLEKNNLPTTTQTMITGTEEDEEDEDLSDDNVQHFDAAELKRLGIKLSAPMASTRKGNPANGVQKSRGMTHSRGGVALAKAAKSSSHNKNRREYPPSWGFDKGQMTMKKRVVTVFDGARRLAKDDMMLSTEHEVRFPLADGKYVTDLDVQCLRRAEGFLGASEAEKGPWLSDDPTEAEYKLMADPSLGF